MNYSLLLASSLGLCLNVASFAQLSPSPVDSLETSQALAATEEASEEDPVAQIIPPSPTAASLSRYADVPVSYYSGLPTIRLPLYEIREHDIRVPIALTYHASGIKVNQEASWVGLGWDLQAGGVIARQVMNHDDFDPAFNYFDADVPSFIKPASAPRDFLQAGCQPQVVNATTGQMGEVDLSPYINSSVNDPYEFEPDHYSFNFLDYTGTFVLTRDYEAILAQQTKMDIQCDPTGSTWTLRAENGFTYRFERYESYTDNQISRPVRTAWYLSSVRSTRGDSVTFHYNQDNSYSQLTGDLIEERSEQRTFTGSGGPTDPNQGDVCQRNPVRRLLTQKAYRNLTLSYIDFSHGRVTFDYNDDRDDLEGGKRLNAVQIFKKNGAGELAGQPERQFVFAYDYFVGTNDDDIGFEPGDYTTKRLKLLSVQEVGQGERIPPHVFSYYEGSATDNLPSKNSFARDHWGYFNGAFGNTTLVPEFRGQVRLDDPGGQYVELPGANRRPDPRYTQAFSLKRIQYPTQGYRSFTYQTHDFDPDNSGQSPVPTDRDEVIERDKAHPLSHDKEQTRVTRTLDVRPAAPGANGTVQARLKAAFRLSAPYDPQNPPPVTSSSTNAYFELYDAQGNQVSRVQISEATCQGLVCEYENTYTFRLEEYTWKSYIARDGEEPVAGLESINVNYIFDEIIPPSSDETSLLRAGGLRVHTITSNDGVGHSPEMIRRFVYTYEEDRDEDGTPEVYSYGRRMTYPVYERYEQNRGFFNNGDVYKCLWFVRTASSSVPLNGTAGGSVVGYDQVSVLHGPDGTLGKTTYHYENISDVVYFYDQRRPPGLTNLVSNKNGLLKQQTDYAYANNAYRKVREVVNDYALKKNRVVYGVHSQDIGYQTDLGQCNFRLFFYPALQSDWVQLVATTETQFDQKDVAKALIQQITYGYEEEPKHYQTVRRTTTDSEQRPRVTNYKYAADFTDNTYGSQALREAHMHSQVLEQVTTVNDTPVRKLTTTYTNAEGPVVPTTVQDYPTGVGEAQTTTYRYDSEGNARQVTGPDGVPTAFVWGYDRSLPVAQVVGATFSQVEGQLGSDFHAGAQGLSEAQAQTLRGALKPAQVTTYTYDPLVGMTSQTDANGRTTTYSYDALNRLEGIKNDEGQVVQKLEYQYAQP